MTKSGELSRYNLEIDKTEIRIVALTSKKVKSTIRLSEIHIRDAQKQPRLVSASENAKGDDSPVNLKKTCSLYWYPLKIIMQQNKSRSIFFGSRA